jgi:hypothetical protein
MIEELQRHNYSQATIESYIFSVREYAEYFHKSPALLGADEVRKERLPVGYFHIVFSVPHQLIPLMWQNKKLLFSLAPEFP